MTPEHVNLGTYHRVPGTCHTAYIPHSYQSYWSIIHFVGGVKNETLKTRYSLC
jgi:hypothetical protein